MKTITIINAYGKKNIGDAAILEQSLSLIEKSSNEKLLIYILCEDQNAFDLKNTSKVSYILKQLPYGYAIKEGTKKSSSFEKVYKFSFLFFVSIYLSVLGLINSKLLPTEGVFSYIKAIKDSDSIIGMGGGYLISKNPIKDLFGLLLTLLPIYVAKINRKKIFFLPISFGPFANDLHKKIAYNAIQSSIIAIREDISVKEIKMLNKPSDNIEILEAPDLVLSYPNSTKNAKKKSNNSIVLTAREWLPEVKQKKFEHEIVQFIDKLWKVKQIKTHFIAMSFNEVEDNDHNLAKRVQKKIISQDSFVIENVKEPKAAQKVIADSRIAVCTRMHSAILAYTTDTPFISIGYGHKANGLMKYLGLLDWYIDIDKVTAKNLEQKFNKLTDTSKYDYFIDTIEKTKPMILKEHEYLQRRLHDFIN